MQNRRGFLKSMAGGIGGVALMTVGRKAYAADIEIEQIGNARYLLGEGPVWDSRENTLYVTSLNIPLFGNAPEENNAGGLFAVRGLGFTGMPEPHCSA